MSRIEDLARFVLQLQAATPNTPAHEVAALASKLVRAAGSLHRRYEAACSYEWACTEAYERGTERKEQAAGKLCAVVGLGLAFQRDPRGAPLAVCRKDGTEIHVPY